MFQGKLHTLFLEIFCGQGGEEVFNRCQGMGRVIFKIFKIFCGARKYLYFCEGGRGIVFLAYYLSNVFIFYLCFYIKLMNIFHTCLFDKFISCA